MVIINVFGNVVSEVHQMKTQTSVPRVFFDVESTDVNSLPIRYTIVSFGNVAERVLDEVRTGDAIFVSGRLTAGGAPRRVNVTLSAFQVLTQGAAADAEPR